MAEDAANGITYLLEIQQTHQHYLGQIRHWTHLSIATGNGVYWIKGLTEAQVTGVEVKSIPFTQLYSLRGQQLFRVGGLVPEKTLPAGLQFVPVAQGLPVQLPSFNHNYFGIDEQLTIQLLPAEKEQPACGMLVSLEALGNYISTAAAVRLQSLQWMVLDNATALVLGTPLLPVSNAQVLWKDGFFLLPAGYGFEWPALSAVLQQKMKPEGDWILWMPDATYLPLLAQQLKPLSLSSFRLTVQLLPSPGKTPADDGR